MEIVFEDMPRQVEVSTLKARDLFLDSENQVHIVLDSTLTRPGEEGRLKDCANVQSGVVWRMEPTALVTHVFGTLTLRYSPK